MYLEEEAGRGVEAEEREEGEEGEEEGSRQCFVLRR